MEGGEEGAEGVDALVVLGVAAAAGKEQPRRREARGHVRERLELQGVRLLRAELGDGEQEARPGRGQQTIRERQRRGQGLPRQREGQEYYSLPPHHPHHHCSGRLGGLKGLS